MDPLVRSTDAFRGIFSGFRPIWMGASFFGGISRNSAFRSKCWFRAVFANLSSAIDIEGAFLSYISKGAGRPSHLGVKPASQPNLVPSSKMVDSSFLTGGHGHCLHSRAARGSHRRQAGAKSLERVHASEPFLARGVRDFPESS